MLLCLERRDAVGTDWAKTTLKQKQPFRMGKKLVSNGATEKAVEIKATNSDVQASRRRQLDQINTGLGNVDSGYS